MELFAIYQAVYMLFVLFRGYQSLEMKSFILFYAITGVIWLALFVLQGVGLYRMAKNADKPRRWMAFVPFLNLYYITKISGPSTVFGHTMRRSGLYAMIAQIVLVLLNTVSVVGETLLFTKFRSALVFDYENSRIYPEMKALPVWMQKLYNFFQVSALFGLLAEFVYVALIFITLMGLYKTYAPKNAFSLTIFSTVLPFLAGVLPPIIAPFLSLAVAFHYIAIFVLRNRKAVDYEAYLRQAREAFYRSHSPYGTPHQNPYGGGEPTPPPPEPEPFEEFSNGGNSTNREKSDGDDLFD